MDATSLLVLFGATAVGKTDLVTELVGKRYPDRFELIVADSRQIYRGLDVGTAKPNPEERAAVPHHLIDHIDIHEQYDLGRFVADCDRLVGEIRARGRVPIISGGTAFYINGFLCGLPGTPRTPPEIRRQLQEERRSRGAAALHRELRELDPESAAAIDENDQYRIVRAIEVYRTSGRPRSAFRVPTQRRVGVDARVVALRRDREELYRRIEARVDAMFAAGLATEATRLHAAGYDRDSPGLRTIGYREFFEVGGEPPWSESQLAIVRERIVRNTRRYAKRQETFFRRIPGAEWVDATDRDALARIVASIVPESDH